MSIKAYLFDLDGTLANSEKYYCDVAYNFLKEKGCDIEYDEMIRNVVGRIIEDYYSFVSKKLNCSIEEVIAINNKIYGDNPVDYKKYVYPDTKEVLIELKKRNLKLALCTNNDIKAVNSFIEGAKLEEVFDYVICKDDAIFEPKPSPEIYKIAMKKLCLKPEECIIVEDSYDGIVAGIESGAYVIATRESNIEMDLSKANRIINNLSELLD